MKKSVAFLIVIFIFILGWIFIATKTKVPQPTGNTSIILPIHGYKQNTPSYTIVANYATSTPLSARANTLAIKKMNTFVINTIKQFKNTLHSDNNTQKNTTTNLSSTHKKTLQIVYLIASSANTVSYIFTIYRNNNKNLSFYTFTFNKTTGANVSLSDIFITNSKYLSSLSKIAREKLPNNISSGNIKMIDIGTTPKNTNFENFFFDNSDLVILFDPGTVATYKKGPQTLRVPLSEITTVLKSEYR